MAIKLLCLAIAATCWLFSVVSSQRFPADCPKCRADLCPPIKEDSCGAGMTLDKCGCCNVCARGHGELCTHPKVKSSFHYGQCGAGLECRVRTDLRDTTKLESICYCMKEGLVCGTDGNTYPNVCQLMYASVVGGKEIKVAKKGICKSAPVIISPPRNMRNESGSDVILSCEAKGFPIPTIEWSFKRGKKMHALPGDDFHVSVNSRGGPERFQVTGWLQLMDITEEHEGDYFCIAHNTEGTSKEKARLKVKSRKKGGEL